MSRVKMSLLKYFSRKRHQLEPDETSSISESVESSDDESQVAAETTNDERNGKSMTGLTKQGGPGGPWPTIVKNGTSTNRRLAKTSGKWYR